MLDKTLPSGFTRKIDVTVADGKDKKTVMVKPVRRAHKRPASSSPSTASKTTDIVMSEKTYPPKSRQWEDIIVHNTSTSVERDLSNAGRSERALVPATDLGRLAPRSANYSLHATPLRATPCTLLVGVNNARTVFACDIEVP